MQSPVSAYIAVSPKNQQINNGTRQGSGPGNQMIVVGKNRNADGGISTEYVPLSKEGQILQYGSTSPQH